MILACGLVPDRLSGDGPSRLRDSLKSNLFNRVDLERIERGYYEQLLDAGRRLDDLADVPGLRIRRRPGGTWSIPVDDAPLVMRVDDLREVVLKPDDATVQRGVQWRTNAQGMRDRSYAIDKPAGTFRIALVGDSIGAGWGVERRAAVRIDPGASLGRPRTSGERPDGRDHQLRRPGAFPRPALVSLRPDRLAHGSGPGDLRVDRRGRRLGRAAAALSAGAGAGLGFAHLPRRSGRSGGRAVREPRRLQAGTPAATLGHPGRRLPDDGRRLPGAGRADRLGAGSPRRAAKRRGRPAGPGEDRAGRGVLAGRRRDRRL